MSTESASRTARLGGSGGVHHSCTTSALAGSLYRGASIAWVQLEGKPRHPYPHGCSGGLIEEGLRAFRGAGVWVDVLVLAVR